MNYTVKQLSALTGLTPRTLRWYDTIGLLRPRRNGENDYRIYGPAEVERLTQILLYREMGLSLEEIGRLLDDPAYDRTAALRQQLDRLLAQRQQVDRLISVVTGALAEEKGENNMSDQQKFEALRDRVLQENEENYGREAREKYGDRAVDDAGARLRTKDQAAWARMEADAAGYQAALVRAMAEGDPAGESAREACRLHGQWLLHTWRPEMLTPEAHVALVEMYDQDPRFRAYYEQVAPGCAAFFGRAIRAYYGR